MPLKPANVHVLKSAAARDSLDDGDEDDDDLFISRRDLFAAHALGALVAKRFEAAGNDARIETFQSDETIAVTAWQYADAMLATEAIADGDPDEVDAILSSALNNRAAQKETPRAEPEDLNDETDETAL